MKTFTLQAEIGADGHLFIDLPSGLPAGPAEVVVVVQPIAEVNVESEPRQPRRSLRGILAQYGDGPSAEEIDEMRREAWARFPREDVFDDARI